MNNIYDIIKSESITLDSINQAINEWSSLPLKEREEADINCRKKYGMDNIQLCNKLKYIISEGKNINLSLFDNILESVDLESDNPYPDYNIDIFSQEEYFYRKSLSTNLNSSPTIVIIDPFLNDSEPDYTMELLINMINKYNSLNPKNKRISNGYSLQIWGYNVPNMYNIMKNKLDKKEVETELNESILFSEVDFEDPIVDNIFSKIMDRDKIGLLLFKEEARKYPGNMKFNYINTFLKEDIDRVLNNDIEFSGFVPYLTSGEFDYTDLESKLYHFGKVDKLQKEYSLAESTKEKEDIAEKILELGWIPGVEVNMRNMNIAKERQSKWMKTYGANVINITGLESSLNEGVTVNSLYEKYDLYPVHIVLSYTNTKFGKVIRLVKNSKYTHAGLSLDSGLNNIVTFEHGEDYNGFHCESLEDYTKKYKDCIIVLMTIFVDGKTKDKIDTILKDFVIKQDKTSYAFGNLFNILIGKAKENEDNLSLVCSQFVDTVLKLANVELFDKSSNLVIPQDFYTLRKNPKVYITYEGKGIDYNPRKVEGIIYNLFRSSSKPNNYLNYNGISYELESSEFTDLILDYLTPETILEKQFPIKFNKKGDLTINLIKSLEEEYQESHKLLLNYNENNLDGIKHELARLFCLNSIIEKKIQKMKKNEDKDYKSLIDLRARILNDFKKYFKIVMEKEPDFDFQLYFKDSDYYNGSITIDNSVLKFTGDLIKKFLKNQGD